MNDLVPLLSAPPAIGWDRNLDRLLDHIEGVSMSLHAGRMRPDSLLAAIEVAEPVERHLNVVVSRIEAARCPATRDDVGKCLALLVTAFPNAAKADLSGYGRLLIEDVTDIEPSAAAVDKACRELRRSSTFLPAIAEVIAAVRSADAKLRLLLDIARGLPARLSQARADLAREREREEADAARRARQIKGGDERSEADAVREQRRQLGIWRRLGMDLDKGVRDGVFSRELVAETQVESRHARVGSNC